MVESSRILLQTAVPVAVVTYALWAFLSRNKKNDDKQPFHLSYPHPNLPFAVRMIAKMPRFLRRPMLIQGSLPKPPLDGVDLVGPEYDPYEYKELVPNKLWRVRYRYVMDPNLLQALKDFFGIDLTDRSMLDRIQDANIRKHVENHLEYAAELAAKNELLDSKQQQLNKLQAGCEDSQDMLVARLEDGLLLYNPCRMHENVVAFLNTLGVVRYIVSGSSSHTNQIPQAAAIYESAKIILAEAAELKCLAVGMRPADFLYTCSNSGPRSYQAAVSELGAFGVQLFHVVGDVQTQTLVVVVHGHLFDTDLTCYGNGHRWLHVDQEDWEKPTPALNYSQTFYYAAGHNCVVAGYLPDYRLMAMDPSSPFTKLALDEPTSTSCKQMAESLREMLKLDFSWVDNVHSKQRESLPAAEFKRCVDRQWSWLDGESLVTS